MKLLNYFKTIDMNAEAFEEKYWKDGTESMSRYEFAEAYHKERVNAIIGRKDYYSLDKNDVTKLLKQ